MAKIYGLFGSLTGKLADTVMSVRNGEQIARKYQPVVFNPSTPAQVAQRAKMKLMSQLSAVMAPIIAFRKKGSVSSRNIFTKKNFGAATYSNDTAQIDILAIDLTGGLLNLPTISITRESSNLNLSLGNNVSLDIDRVVYAAFERDGDELRYIGSSVATTPGENNSFETTIAMDGPNQDVVVYAYGVRDNTDAARVTFSNLSVPTAASIAKILVTSALTEADVTLTMTRAAESVPSRGGDDPEPEKKSTKKN